MENENHKRKNDLMKSIMSDPKMARSFREALASPIGSTKRNQAKSLLSIMKKVGGLRNDGMGGPLVGMSSGSTPMFGAPPVNQSSNSYYMFPAAPALKSNIGSGITTIKTQTNTSALSGNQSSNISPTVNDNLFSIPKSISNYNLTLPPTPGASQKSGLVSGSQSLRVPFPSVVPPTQDNITTPTPLIGVDAIKKIQTDLNTKNAGQQGWVPLVVDGIAGKKTNAAQNFVPTTTIVNNVPANTNTIGTTGTTQGTSNLAAKSVATILKLTPITPLAQVPIKNLATAIATNEGFYNGTSKIAIANNNPGNLKFANQPGATQDSRGFAVFSTVEAGNQALINDLTSKYNSGKYQTINDLMTVYSPDSDNPSSPLYGTTNTSQGSQITSNAQKAVKEGTGPGLFALNEVNSKFGGSLDAYINTLDEKLKKDSKIEPLELELSNLKSQSENFIPTLSSYIKGKDQYSSAIDKMISNAEGQLLTTNMADPFTANQYKNYMTYLYTLKGRQNERYGNYLNAAISDYNADVTKVQANYENVYKRYTDALTRQGTIAQSEYNTLYTTMSDLYTNLENAPIRAQNARILQQQIDTNDLTALKNGLTTGSIYPDYHKDTDTFSKNITDKDGLLLINQLGAGGLLGQFNQAVNLSGEPQKALAVANAVNIAMAKTLSSSTDPMADVNKFKGLVRDLSEMEGGAEYANMIKPSLNKASYTLVSDYVLKNLSTIKEAANKLVSGTSHFFSKDEQSGLSNKAAWKKNFSGIDSSILDDLYDLGTKAVLPGSEYQTNPAAFVIDLFSDEKGNPTSDQATMTKNFINRITS